VSFSACARTKTKNAQKISPPRFAVPAKKNYNQTKTTQPEVCAASALANSQVLVKDLNALFQMQISREEPVDESYLVAQE